MTRLGVERHMEEHGYLYKTEVLFTRKNEYWVVSQYDGHVHGTQMSSHVGPFFETHPHASSQASLSPVLWSSYSFCVHVSLTKPSVTAY